MKDTKEYLIQRDDENISDFIERIAKTKTDTGHEVEGKTYNEITLKTEDFPDSTNLYSDLSVVYAEAFARMSSNGENEINDVSDDELAETAEANSAKEDTSALDNLSFLASTAIFMTTYSEYDQEDIERIQGRVEEDRKNYDKIKTEKSEEYNQKMQMCRDMAKHFVDEMNSHNQALDEQLVILKRQKEEYLKDKESITEQFQKEQDSLDKSYSELQTLVEQNPEIKQVMDAVTTLHNKGIKITLNDTIKEIGRLDGLTQPVIEKLNEIKKGSWGVEAYQEYMNEFLTEDYYNSIEEQIEQLESRKITKQDVVRKTDEFAESLFDGAIRDAKGNLSYSIKNDPELQYAQEAMEESNQTLQELEKNPSVIKHQITKMMEEKRPIEEIAPKLDMLASYISVPVIEGTIDKDASEVIDLQIEFTKQEIQKLEKKIDTDDYIDDELIAIDSMRKMRLESELANVEEELTKYDQQVANSEDSQELRHIEAKIKSYEKLIKNIKKQEHKHLLLNGNNENDEQIGRLNDSIDYYMQVTEGLIDQKIELQREKNSRTDKRKANIFTKKKHQELIQMKEKLTSKLEKLNASITEKKNNRGYIDIAQENEDIIDLDELKSELANLEEKKDFLEIHNVEEMKNQILQDYKKSLEPEQKQEKYDSEEDLENKIISTTEEEIKKEKEVQDKSAEEIPNPVETDQELPEISDEELEEIEETFTKAPNKIIEKLKSLSFKKIAIKAIAGIVAAVTIIASGIKMSSKEAEAQIKNAPEMQAETLETMSEPIIEKQVQEIANQIVEETKAKENTKAEEVAPKVEQPEISEEQGKVDTSRIASNAYDAQNGNFIDESKIYKPAFETQDVSIEDFYGANGDYMDGSVQAVRAEDGTIIGFTSNADVENTEEMGRTR